MRKICEIDGAESYNRTGELPLAGWHSKNRVNTQWVKLHFTEAQQQFLDKHQWSIRHHPRHFPTLELFVDETDLTEQDWTVVRLLF